MSYFQTNKAQLPFGKGPYTEEKLLEVESNLSRIEITETRKEKIIRVQGWITQKASSHAFEQFTKATEEGAL